jgi:hypothetical protein
MYRLFLKGIFAICVLFCFWPVIRLYGVTVFDCLTPIVILFGLAHKPTNAGVSFASFKLATVSIALLALAGVISYSSSNDSYEHILRIVNLVVALGGITGLAYVLANRKIFSVTEALFLLCLSASISSAVSIVQGRFGILTNIIPTASTGINDWTRMTGLAEHPIETGVSSAFGIVLALGLGIYTRKWVVYLPLIALNVYSLEYSASLTALLAFLFASTVSCFFARAYKILWVGLIVGIFGMTLAFSYGALGLLTSRLDTIVHSPGSYATLQSREMQWRTALEKVEPSTLAVGNGYSISDLPYHMEIHNGLVASLFHFGLLGLISQCLLIAFFVVRLRHEAPRELKAILVGCIIIFAVSYLTGPALSRRSLWVPLIILGGYLTTSKPLMAYRSNSAGLGMRLDAQHRTL